jgi:predicted ArsR family transcriptional regulator
MSTQTQILEFLEKTGQATSLQISEGTGLNRDTVLQYLNAMLNDCMVYRGDKLGFGGFLWSTKPMKLRHELVLDALKKHRKMTAAEISEATGISKKMLSDVLRKMELSNSIMADTQPFRGLTIKTYWVHDPDAEVKYFRHKPVEQHIPENPFAHLFKGSPWQGAENFIKADPNK